MRMRAGAANSTSYDTIEDSSLRGLEELIAQLPSLPTDEALEKAFLLWEALSDVFNYRGAGTFSGTYKWFYFHARSCQFDPLFIRTLNKKAWVMSPHGQLARPSALLFDDLDWKTNTFLASKIRFKPPAIEALAREAGIEPGLLDLLKSLGLTSEADLKAKLGIVDEPQSPTPVQKTTEELTNDNDGNSGKGPSSTRATEDNAASSSSNTQSPPTDNEKPGSDTPESSKVDRTSSERGKPNQSEAGYDFVSYVAAVPDEEPDPDGLDHEARMALEEQAIKAILLAEPLTQRTPVNNPGFDLFERDGNGDPAKWIEVKAMKRNWRTRPVGLSRTQFHMAMEKGTAYWLYVVENAADSGAIRIVKVQDPAGKARTFTFDHGWSEIAKD